jgi:hypothetical protein
MLHAYGKRKSIAAPASAEVVAEVILGIDPEPIMPRGFGSPNISVE